MVQSVQHTFQQRGLSTLSSWIGWNAWGFDGALNVDITELLEVKLTKLFFFRFPSVLLCAFKSARSHTPEMHISCVEQRTRKSDCCAKWCKIQGSRPIWCLTRAFTSCWPPMLQSSLRKRLTMSSFPWQRLLCLSSNPHPWWSNVILATASTWPAAWCTAEPLLLFSLNAFWLVTSVFSTPDCLQIRWMTLALPRHTHLGQLESHVLFPGFQGVLWVLLVALDMSFMLRLYDKNFEEMLCRRMWTLLWPPSRPSAPFNSWTGIFGIAT